MDYSNTDTWTLTLNADKIRMLLNRGYGRTGKPLPEKRIQSLRKKLAEIEHELADRN